MESKEPVFFVAHLEQKFVVKLVRAAEISEFSRKSSRRAWWSSKALRAVSIWINCNDKFLGVVLFGGKMVVTCFYTPGNKDGTWKCLIWKGNSFINNPIWSSMLVFQGVTIWMMLPHVPRWCCSFFLCVFFRRSCVECQVRKMNAKMDAWQEPDVNSINRLAVRQEIDLYCQVWVNNMCFLCVCVCPRSLLFPMILKAFAMGSLRNPRVPNYPPPLVPPSLVGLWFFKWFQTTSSDCFNVWDRWIVGKCSLFHVCLVKKAFMMEWKLGNWWTW